MAIFVYGMIGWTVKFSLSNRTSAWSKDDSFAGLKNFTGLLEDPEFTHAFSNLVKFTLVFMIGTLISGLIMALLLEKGRTQKEKLDIANRLINYMGSLGVSVGKGAVTPALNYLSADGDRPAPAAPSTAPSDAARQLRQLPVAPTTRGVPGLSFKPGAPAQQGAAGGAPADPNARSMMQSLFPFDSISAMASQQQPPPAPG